MEHHVQLQNGKCRRRYAPGHALFAVGDALRSSKFYQAAGVEMGEEEDDEGDEEKPVVFACRLAKCNGVGFHSLHAYEEHYDLVHRNVCRECFRSFLSFRLLDIHLSETHDALFRVMAKRQPMYACLVDGCDKVFRHDDKRTRHLVSDHQFPANFSLHNARRVPRRHATPANTTGKETDREMYKDVDAIKKAKAQARKEKRRAKKKQEAADRKTKQIAPPADDKMMEDDAGPVGSQVVAVGGEDAARGDVAMQGDDQLVERMQQLFIPRSISFGRRPHQRR